LYSWLAAWVANLRTENNTIMLLKITGKLPSGRQLQRLQQSPNYKEGAFQNLSVTPMKPEGVSYWKMMREFFKKHPETSPTGKIPFVKTDLKKLNTAEPVIVWFGHSSYFLRINNKNFLIDPVFSGNAAPVSFMVKSFPGSNEYKADDMPPIDYLILTHDHYDHLDFKTIRQLKSKIGKVICSLGISSHLKHWGIDENKISELDWWQSTELEANMQLTAAPARHFSGRGIKRAQTLWSSFILKTETHNLYLGGDSGYDTHFAAIGEKYGPFDIAILEAGQYNTMWPYIHMMPEEAVQAVVDLKAKTLLPVHWGKFKLSMHIWNEPIKRIVEKAKDLNVPVFTPMIGQPLILDGHFRGTDWWDIPGKP
jgi:L-ascorbate metabolism protein UlaG (beta-lactamase superfamily)